jgi:hypothetical protein
MQGCGGLKPKVYSRRARGWRKVRRQVFGSAKQLRQSRRAHYGDKGMQAFDFENNSESEGTYVAERPRKGWLLYVRRVRDLSSSVCELFQRRTLRRLSRALAPSHSSSRTRRTRTRLGSLSLELGSSDGETPRPSLACISVACEIGHHYSIERT